MCGFPTKRFRSYIASNLLRRIRRKILLCDVYRSVICTEKWGLLLDQHMTIHTGEKPNQCILYEKEFSQESGIDKHMMVHNEEKPLQCTKCDKAFSQNTRIRSENITKFHFVILFQEKLKIFRLLATLTHNDSHVYPHCLTIQNTLTTIFCLLLDQNR